MRIACSLILLALTLLASSALAASFTGLGALSADGDYRSETFGISASGAVVVGRSISDVAGGTSRRFVGQPLREWAESA